MKIIMKIGILLSISSTIAMTTDVKDCQGCHGVNYEKKALGMSKIIKDMTKEEMIKALSGYKAGTYGGKMKGIMVAQIKSFSSESIEKLVDAIKGVLIENKAEALKLVEKNGNSFGLLSDELKNDRELVMLAVKNNGAIWHDIPNKFKDDKEIAIVAVSKTPYIYEYLPSKLQKNREIAVMVLKKDSSIWKKIPKSFKKDKTFILEVIKNSKVDRYKNLPISAKIDKDIALMCKQKGEKTPEYDTYILFDKLTRNHIQECINKHNNKCMVGFKLTIIHRKNEKNIEIQESIGRQLLENACEEGAKKFCK